MTRIAAAQSLTILIVGTFSTADAVLHIHKILRRGPAEQGWLPSSLADISLTPRGWSPEAFVDAALYNLDKLANATIDDVKAAGDPVDAVRREDGSEPMRSHHKLVVLFFIVAMTFLVGVICMTAVFYSREKLDLDTAGYGSFGIAKQHKAGLKTGLQKKEPIKGEVEGDTNVPPATATLYKQALVAHQAAIAAKESSRNVAPRRKSTPLPSIDEANFVGYAPSNGEESDLETQSLASHPGFSVAVTDSDCPTPTHRSFPQPRDRW
jgi:hypothetical protein